MTLYSRNKTYHAGLGFLVGQFELGEVDRFLHPVSAKIG